MIGEEDIIGEEGVATSVLSNRGADAVGGGSGYVTA